MERQPPVAPSDEIDLYVRTYTSLLRSTGDVRVRAFEEAHAFCRSSLHEGALSTKPDVSAFAYAAARLPEVMPEVKLVVLGQSHELFEAAGFDVRKWTKVTTRGRRRPQRYDGAGTLAVFIASDIDDLGHPVLAPPIAPLEEPQLLRRRQHVRMRDRDRAEDPLARGRALGVKGEEDEERRRSVPDFAHRGLACHGAGTKYAPSE